MLPRTNGRPAAQMLVQGCYLPCASRVSFPNGQFKGPRSKIHGTSTLLHTKPDIIPQAPAPTRLIQLYISAARHFPPSPSPAHPLPGPAHGCPR